MKKFPVCTPASYRTSSPYEPFYTQATIEDQEHDFRAIVYIKAKRTISLMERVSCRIVCWSDTRLLLSLSTPLLLWMWQFFSENLAISFTDSRWSKKTKVVKWEFLFNCFCFFGPPGNGFLWPTHDRCTSNILPVPILQLLLPFVRPLPFLSSVGRRNRKIMFRS